MTQYNININEIKNAVNNLPFAYMAHEVHAEGRITIDQAVAYMTDQLGIDEGDTSLTARAIREYLGCILNTFYDDIEDYDTLDAKEQDARDSITYTLCEHKDVTYWLCFEIFDNYWNADYMLEYVKMHGNAQDIAHWEDEKQGCDEYRYRKAA